PADGVGGRGYGPSVWHMQEVGESRQRFQQFARQVIERANAGMPIGQLAGIGLGVVDELSQCPGRHCGMDHERERRNHDVRNWLELLERIVERTALEDRLGDMGARAAQEDGVAIRTDASDGSSTEPTATSPRSSTPPLPPTASPSSA